MNQQPLHFIPLTTLPTSHIPQGERRRITKNWESFIPDGYFIPKGEEEDFISGVKLFHFTGNIHSLPNFFYERVLDHLTSP